MFYACERAGLSMIAQAIGARAAGHFVRAIALAKPMDKRQLTEARP